MGLKTRGLFTESNPAVGPGVALSNGAFASWQTQKAKCYKIFSAPEKILILNLWPQLHQQFDFSQALCRKYYHSKRFVDQTCEKMALKTRGLQQEFLLRLRRSTELR